VLYIEKDRNNDKVGARGHPDVGLITR